jgi:hypothetical protein
MTDVILQVRFDTPSGVMVNTFNFHATSYLTYALHAADCIDEVKKFYEDDGGSGTSSIGAAMANYVARGYTLRAYNRADPTPRVPLLAFSALHATVSPTTLQHIPMDVAMCLSYHAAPPVTRRRRGRIYLGGVMDDWLIEGGPGTPPRFNTTAATVATRVVTAATALAAHEVGWSIWSEAAGGASKIVGGFIDTEPDTQRRRGVTTPSKLGWGA